MQSIGIVWPGKTVCSQLSSVAQSCPTLRHQASLSLPNSGSLVKLMSIELVMPSNHLVLCHLLLLPPSIFPSIRVFSKRKKKSVPGAIHKWGTFAAAFVYSQRREAAQCVSTVLCVLRHVQLFVIPWTVAHQAPLCMEFSRQEHWIGMSFPTPGDIPNPGIKPTSLASPALAGRFFTMRHLGNPSLQ